MNKRPDYFTRMPKKFQNTFSWEPDVPRKQWYGIQAVAADEHDIHIMDFIGAYGVEASTLVKDLSSLKGKLNVRLNTPGGDVFDGLAIYNALKRHKGPVDVHVDGLAASIGSVIAMAGETITMHEGAMMMIHDAWGMAIGNAADMEDMAATLDKVSGELAGIYAERTGMKADAARDIMKAETWLTAEEAQEAGFASTPAAPPAEASSTTATLTLGDLVIAKYTDAGGLSSDATMTGVATTQPSQGRRKRQAELALRQ